MAQFTLRTGTPEDVPAMHALDLQCFARPFRFDLKTMRRFATEAGVIRIVAEIPAEAGPILAGFVLLGKGLGTAAQGLYVTTLDVHPDHRRLGIGQALMAEAEHCASVARANSVALHVYTANEAAIAFYEQAGYARHSLHASFYGAGLDAWEYHKLID